MIEYSNQTIEGEVIELNNNDLNYLGYNLKLIKCTVNIRAKSKNVVITRSEFENCTIIAKDLKNFDWKRIRLINCFFAGNFPENNFGNSLIEEDYPTVIENCDFSHTKIDSVRFYDVNMGTIKLPSESFITIFEPKKFAKQSPRSQFVEKLESFFDFLSPQNNRVSAFTFDSIRVTRKYNLNEEEIQTLLSEIHLHNQSIHTKEQ